MYAGGNDDGGICCLVERGVCTLTYIHVYDRRQDLDCTLTYIHVYDRRKDLDSLMIILALARHRAGRSTFISPLDCLPAGGS